MLIDQKQSQSYPSTSVHDYVYLSDRHLIRNQPVPSVMYPWMNQSRFPRITKNLDVSHRRYSAAFCIETHSAEPNIPKSD